MKIFKLIGILKFNIAIKRDHFYIKGSNEIKAFLFLLYKKGLLNFTQELEDKIKISIVYYEGKSIISDIKIISKPSKKIYANKKNIFRYAKQHENKIIIMRTSSGFLTMNECLSLNRFGEIFCLLKC